MTIRIEITGPRATGKTLILRAITSFLTPFVVSANPNVGKFDGFADLDMLEVETDDTSIQKLLRLTRVEQPVTGDADHPTLSQRSLAFAHAAVPDGLPSQAIGALVYYAAQAVQDAEAKGSRAAGVWDAVKVVEKRRDDYIREHGNTDPETGCVEFPGNGDEYVAELDEIVEALQKLVAP